MSEQTNKEAEPSLWYVRVKPYDPKKGHHVQRYTFRSVVYREDRGWYTIADEKLAQRLKKIRQDSENSNSPRVFDVCTRAEALAIQKREARMVRSKGKRTVQDLDEDFSGTVTTDDLPLKDGVKPGREQRRKAGAPRPPPPEEEEDREDESEEDQDPEPEEDESEVEEPEEDKPGMLDPDPEGAEVESVEGASDEGRIPGVGKVPASSSAAPSTAASAPASESQPAGGAPRPRSRPAQAPAAAAPEQPKSTTEQPK